MTGNRPKTSTERNRVVAGPIIIIISEAVEVNAQKGGVKRSRAESTIRTLDSGGGAWYNPIIRQTTPDNG